MPWGENTTLQRGSEIWSDPLHLSKEGSLTPPQNLRLQDTTPPFQASFTLSAVTSAHSGTYTCYSSLSTSPSLMSQPSDPWSPCSQVRSPLPTSIEEPDPRLTALSQEGSELEEEKRDTGTPATGGPTPRRDGQYRGSPCPSTPLTPPQGPGRARCVHKGGGRAEARDFEGRHGAENNMKMQTRHTLPLSLFQAALGLQTLTHRHERRVCWVTASS